MLQLLPRRLVLHGTTFAGTLLLHACSQASPDTAADSALAAATAPIFTKRTTGTAADSLNGMQGHTFGEPLRNFSGLVLLTKEDKRGVRVYQMLAGNLGPPTCVLATGAQQRANDGRCALRGWLLGAAHVPMAERGQRP